MLLRSEPLKEPESIQSWERLKPLDSWMAGSQTLMVALAPYTGCCCEEGAVYAMACCELNSCMQAGGQAHAACAFIHSLTHVGRMAGQYLPIEMHVSTAPLHADADAVHSMII